MLYVSLIVESLRSRPRLMFWIAALAQAFLWTLVPSLFYFAPPGDVPLVIAVGHEFQLGSDLGPPLAFWLGETVFRFAGTFGLYLLSQACVVVALWCIFALGRETVGISHAVLAVLLMAGIAGVAVATPEFGPEILAMPIWAVVLLHYWRVIGEGRSGYWFLLALEIGLLLLTSYLGLLLFALLAVFTIASRRGRAALRSSDPWICAAVALLVAVPYLVWFCGSENIWMPMLTRLRNVNIGGDAAEWIRIIAALVMAHAGMVVLVLLASGWPSARQEKVATVSREPMPPQAKALIYFFALAPGLAATLALVLLGQPWTLATAAPLVICSGLAVIVAGGETIRLCRQRALSLAWAGLLAGPPVLMAIAVVALPWTLAVDLKVLQPAEEMGRFFADSFQRRTGKPLAVVAGDARTAALIAMQARSRPSLYLDAAPERSPWIRAADIQEKGAVVVWPATDRAGTPPPSIKASFPDLAVEVPRAFERPIQGRLPLLRIGWGVIRPQADTPAASPAPSQTR